MQEPPNEGPDDWYFDESLQRWGRYSGRARWRKILDERRALYAADPGAGRRWFQERFGITMSSPTPVPGARMAGMEQENNAAETDRPPTASQRFAALIGIPAPTWTDDDEARFQAKMSAADADLFARIERRTSGRSAA